MRRQALWEQYQRGGWSACDARLAVTADELHYLAVLAASERAWAEAAPLAERAAAADPASLLLAEAARYLARRAEGQRDVAYSEGDTADGPAAFAAFVRGGGNVPLYGAVSAALAEQYRNLAQTQGRGVRLLDIGVGDGRALVPAVSEAVAELGLLEPSTAMLDTCLAALQGRNIPTTTFVMTLQDYLASRRDRWDLTEATFSLHNLPPVERVEVLGRLRGRCRRLLLAEFDVREFSHDLAPERVAHCRDRFEEGLLEYAEPERDLIARGFLMPVYFGYFDPGAERVTHEHSLRTWVEQLQRAGYDHVRCQLLYRYWWAPAYLIDAS